VNSSSLAIKPKDATRWDLVSLGEVMLRLDPGIGRVHTARRFDVWEGGGEYNVARGLKRCFGLRTAVVTALADNPIGRLVEDLIYQGGVDQSHLRWVKYDGVGRTVRNGLNLTERGHGVRAALGCSDRGHTAVSQLKPGEIDWDEIFVKEGTRWFHTGGIFAALSDSTPLVAKEAIEAAHRNGVIVSYDLNYRDSLWKSIGGKARALEVDEHIGELDTTKFRGMIQQAVAKYPNFKVVATTLRTARTATVNDWGAVCYANEEYYEARPMSGLEILDRVGGGDSFASGLIYGFLAEKGPQYAVDCGCAHGALAMTTPGDTTMVTLPEVERVMKGGAARVLR
jgi:2-dehydro-3-deoxygluconokinase